MRVSLQNALVGTTDGVIGISHSMPIPEVSGNRVLIKIKAVSVNPVDSKMAGAYITPGAIAGCDAAGVVDKLGPDVTHVKVGDRVCTSVMGMNPLKPTVGAFAEYTTALYTLLLKLPPSMSFEQGASLPTSFFTAGLSLFHSLGLPGRPFEPSSKPTTVLVYGGSSATGTAAIQLLKLAGFDIVTTCSPHNFDLVRGYGAGTVFDYNTPIVRPRSGNIREMVSNMRWIAFPPCRVCIFAIKPWVGLGANTRRSNPTQSRFPRRERLSRPIEF